MLGMFSNEEKQKFEFEFNASSALQQDVMLQQQLVQRIQLNAFAADIKEFHTAFTGDKNWFKRNFYLNGLLLLLFSAAGLYYFSQTDNTSNNPSFASVSALHNNFRNTNVDDTSYVSANDSSAMKEETGCIKNDSTRRLVTPLNNESAKWIPEYLQVPYTVKEVDASQSLHIKMTSNGSIIHIRPHILVHQNGAPVVGKFQVKYREFRDACDMAFSDIPMIYHGDGSEKFMNSVGMFEIRAYQNGEELKIAEGKSITVDYAITQRLDSIYFFSLNEETRQWKKRFRIGALMFKSKLIGGQGSPNYKNFNETSDSINRARRDTVKTRNTGNVQSNIVRNLQLSCFGIFNCDQVNRLNDRVDITASYVNTNGDKITNMSMLMVIDRNYNNAIPHFPGNFALGRNGRNILILTGSDGHIYTVGEQEFKKMQILKSGKYEFTVSDVTQQMKTMGEFRKILGL
ncbi:MAG: hypothetical protein ACHQF2_08050, partial [Flavobacteriales bacterium]